MHECFLPFPSLPQYSSSLSFPKSLEELRALSVKLSLLQRDHFYSVLGLFSAAYLFKQSFAIPGSVFLVNASTLAGFFLEGLSLSDVELQSVPQVQLGPACPGKGVKVQCFSGGSILDLLTKLKAVLKPYSLGLIMFFVFLLHIMCHIKGCRG